MDEIITDVFNAMVLVCNKETQPVDLIKTGVDVLQKTNISNDFKREIIKVVLKKIAYGSDGEPNTADDRLSQNTLGLLIILIDADLTDIIITGVVSGAKKITSKCWGFL